MSDEVLMSNFQDDTNGTCGLTKNEVIKLLYNSDSSIELIAPEKFKSPIWERFRLVFYKGNYMTFMVVSVTRTTSRRLIVYSYKLYCCISPSLPLITKNSSDRDTSKHLKVSDL